MTTFSGDAALGLSDLAAIDQLRSVLASAGYSASTVKTVIRSEVDDVPLWATSIPAALWRLRGDTVLGPLVKLFFLGISVPMDEAAVALAPLSLDGLADVGLVELRDGSAEGLVRLVPSGGLILACDRQVDAVPRRDHVMGVTPSSVLLANITIRRRVESALDLGTGAGVQALLAARHAERVVATDLSPRAVDFARFNCRLNEIANVDIRLGDLFEPVAGETFDLIVSNPPYVISPDFDILFRDGGRPYDEISRSLVTEVPNYLHEGGLAHFTISWACRNGDGRYDSPRRWIEAAGCDGRLVCVEFRDALGHAAMWNRNATADQDRYVDDFNRWAEYLEKEGIREVGTAGLTLRRRKGPNWVRVHEVTGYKGPRAGAQLERLLEAEDRAEQWSVDELLDQALRPGSHHHLEQRLAPGSSGYDVTETEVVLDGGLPVRFRLNPLITEVLIQLDGSRLLRDAVAAAAEITGEPADSPDVAAALRELVRLGVLVLTETPGGER